MKRANILIRKDLEMSVPKLAIQVGHGVELLCEHSTETILKAWKHDGSRKILLAVNTSEQLENIEILLKEAGIPYSRIYDHGYTEFEGKTYTGIVVYPLDEEHTPKKIKRLRLWEA